MSKRIQCISADNSMIEFSYEENADYFLDSLEGVYDVKNSVITTENTMIDGSVYQSSRTPGRNIVINALIFSDYKAKRDAVYRVFRKGKPGTFRHIDEDGEIREITYYAESILADEKGIVRSMQISLICPDPMFRDPYAETVQMAGWENLFEFEVEFIDGEPVELTRRRAAQIEVIDYDGTVDEAGMEITIKATATVTNPSISHVEQGQTLEIETELEDGESLRITTGLNDKRVYLISSTGEETPADGLISEDSEFIQLGLGSNSLQYDALYGEENMDVTIKYYRLFAAV